MGSIEKGFLHYCCVAKGGKIYHSYNDNNSINNVGGDLETENLATLCLEKVPQYHKWYTQTMNKRTFSYLMEDGYVYFAIADVGHGNQALLRFLEHYRDEFKKVTKLGSSLRLSWKGKGKNSMSSSNLNSVNLQEQLVPVIRQLITSLQNVGQSSNGNGNGKGNAFNPSSSPCGGRYGNSTKAPLLGAKSGKQDKRSKDHVIGMRGIELEEQCRSSDRGLRVDSDSDETRAAGSSPVALQKEMISVRRRSSSQNVRRKWCRLVRFVLAIDAGLCIILLIIWLVICKGIQCIR